MLNSILQCISSKSHEQPRQQWSIDALSIFKCTFQVRPNMRDDRHCRAIYMWKVGCLLVSCCRHCLGKCSDFWKSGIVIGLDHVKGWSACLLKPEPNIWRGIHCELPGFAFLQVFCIWWSILRGVPVIFLWIQFGITAPCFSWRLYLIFGDSFCQWTEGT